MKKIFAFIITVTLSFILLLGVMDLPTFGEAKILQTMRCTNIM